MLTVKDIKTGKRFGNHIIFHVPVCGGLAGTGAWKETRMGKVYYVSDTWSCHWRSISEAKEFIAEKANAGYFGMLA